MRCVLVCAQRQLGQRHVDLEGRRDRLATRVAQPTTTQLVVSMPTGGVPEAGHTDTWATTTKYIGQTINKSLIAKYAIQPIVFANICVLSRRRRVLTIHFGIDFVIYA